MIYVTGDCHQDFRRFNARNFPEQREMTKEDYVIICGDFGGVWNKGGESGEEKHLLDWLEGYTAQGGSLIWCSHHREELDRLCGAVLTLENGVLGA